MKEPQERNQLTSFKERRPKEDARKQKKGRPVRPLIFLVSGEEEDRYSHQYTS